jgi:glycosyltransferase involved in cell wall biosynthesis
MMEVLLEHTQNTVTLAVLDDETALHVSSLELGPAVAPELVEDLSAAGRAAAAESLRVLLQECRGDIVVLQAGAIVPAGWLEELRTAAYSDSIYASASAVALPSEGDPSGLIALGPAPLRGAVYVRRDALAVSATALEVAGETGDSMSAVLWQSVDIPGLVHRVASTVAVTVRTAPVDPEGRRRVRTDVIDVLIDARCLDHPLSGTQVHVTSVVEALLERDDVRVACLRPRAIHDSAEHLVRKLDGASWHTDDSLPSRRPAIFHRPYQFGSVHEVDVSRSLADRLAVTHQDMIMDRTPSYHPSPDDWARFREATAASFSAADQVGFFSRHAAWDALSGTPLTADRACVVPLGVDHPLGDPTPPGRKDGTGRLLDGQPFLLIVGGAMPHKNRPHALRVFERLVADHGWEGLLVLAGDRHPISSSKHAEEAVVASNAALRDRVVDLGRVADGERTWLYQRASLVLFPSLYEGFGLVPFEAARCGTPCVYGWRSSLSEYLPLEGAAFRGWEVAGNAEEVATILRDEERCAAIVEAIRATGRTLTWERTAAGYVELYRRALERPPRLDPQPEALSTWTRERELTPEELELLDVYRRRPVFRGAVSGVVLGGRQALRLTRVIRGRSGQ